MGRPKGSEPATSLPSFASELMTLEQDGHVATLWLDRPEGRNAITQSFFDDLAAAFALLSAEPSVRAVVVAANGTDFCVGLDLKNPGPAFGADASSGWSQEESQAAHAAGLYAHCKRHQDSFTAVANCLKPVIAAVHGNCVGGGLDLIACCDIRLAAADARFAVAETRMSIVADMGTLQRLPAIVGRGDFMELALTGRRIDAERARVIRLVNDVYPDRDAAIAAAHELAQQLARTPPLAVQGTKAVVAAGEGRSVAQGLDYVALWQAAMLHSADLREAIDAFRNKREPQFTGR